MQRKDIEIEDLKRGKQINIGRVCEVQRNLFHIRYEGNDIPAILKGRFHNEKLDFPVVGDYVTFRYNP